MQDFTAKFKTRLTDLVMNQINKYFIVLLDSNCSKENTGRKGNLIKLAKRTNRNKLSICPNIGSNVFKSS